MPQVRDLEEQNFSIEVENKAQQEKIRKLVSATGRNVTKPLNPVKPKDISNTGSLKPKSHQGQGKGQELGVDSMSDKVSLQQDLIVGLHKKLKLKERLFNKLDSQLNHKIVCLESEVLELNKHKKAMGASRRIVEKQSKKINDLANMVSEITDICAINLNF